MTIGRMVIRALAVPGALLTNVTLAVFIFTISMVGVGSANSATLVGTTSDATGIDGLIVFEGNQTLDYNVTFETGAAER